MVTVKEIAIYILVSHAMHTNCIYKGCIECDKSDLCDIIETTVTKLLKEGGY